MTTPAPSPAPARTAEIARTTRETQIRLVLNIDGTGRSEISTGVGFLDHMLELFSRHSLMDLTVQCQGDLHVDSHHTTEDIGICLGQALDRALGDRVRIRRYGHAILPMDETLATCAVDLGGRPFWVWNVAMPGSEGRRLRQRARRRFLAGLHGGIHESIFMSCFSAVTGRNTRSHLREAIFKGLARALRDACAIDPRDPGVPSTKGVL